MNNAVYRKTVENVKNRIDVKLVSNKKRLFIMYIQTKLDGIGKNKVTLTLNKPAYIGICILELEH